MGGLTSYALLSAVYIVAGWAVYRLFLSRSNQPAFNRLYILAVMLFPIVWIPLYGWLPELWRGHEGAVTGDVIELSDLRNVGFTVVKNALWAQIIVVIYSVGVCVTGVLAILSLVRIGVIIHKAERLSAYDGRVLLSREEGIMPFTWGRYIVIPESDQNDKFEMILRHELAHMRHRHWIDLLVAQAVCVFQWFNPAAWALRRDLALIHEYQADAEVLSGGSDAKEYQLLLLRRASSFKSERLLANNLNTNNLKKRIAMMKKEKSGLRSRYGALALIPALMLVFGLTRTTAYAEVTSATSAVTVSSIAGVETGAEEKSDEKVYDSPEVLAEFPGGEMGMMQWLMANMKFPKELEKEDISGRVIVEFVIGPDGKISQAKIVKSLAPEADKEALRVVNAMPDWKPGMVGGKPVATRFVLPISFKTQRDKSNKTKKTIAYFVNGEPFSGGLNTIDSSAIASMEIVKDDPKYPDGRINITLK